MLRTPQWSPAGTGCWTAAHVRASVLPGGRCSPPPVLQGPGRQGVTVEGCDTGAELLLLQLSPGKHCSALGPKACRVLGVGITGGFWYTDASMWGTDGGAGQSGLCWDRTYSAA